jgi:hypothetical protein
MAFDMTCMGMEPELKGPPKNWFHPANANDIRMMMKNRMFMAVLLQFLRFTITVLRLYFNRLPPNRGRMVKKEFFS